MQFEFLIMLAMCALAMAIPLDKRSVESHSESASDESGEVKSTTTNPLPSLIAIKDAADLENRISQAGDKVVIIYFMTTWCPHCKKINPAIEDVAAKTENLIVLKVDRDILQDDETVWKYGLSDLPGVPRFYFIKDGKKVEEIHGSDADISGTLSKVMSPNNDSNTSDSSDE